MCYFNWSFKPHVLLLGPDDPMPVWLSIFDNQKSHCVPDNVLEYIFLPHKACILYPTITISPLCKYPREQGTSRKKKSPFRAKFFFSSQMMTVSSSSESLLEAALVYGILWPKHPFHSKGGNDSDLLLIKRGWVLNTVNFPRLEFSLYSSVCQTVFFIIFLFFKPSGKHWEKKQVWPFLWLARGHQWYKL